ncbi:hypothetical protein Rsub_01773 [Raphidocelis subcapitata]|uniref:Helicase C-terminal domain-containing protein n=1 Tax=Raphidocelis subcapitata TaxID=307507 RepID=A0A2V0NNC9_9CHLO|nr:hypothetical protein Rsub_01773 [Raphidocelis subcapitata]|eukprot:GBF89056.1 hypothetical protein Rsub_01773 [Raphidocelis subcapitata]
MRPVHLHVCGDPAALPLLRALAADCGERLEEVAYQRLSPLTVQRQALRGLEDVAPATPWRGARSGGDGGGSGEPCGYGDPSSSGSECEEDDGGDWAAAGSGGGGVPRRRRRREGGGTGLPRAVGLVYGALPPEARRAQAALFNAGNGGGGTDGSGSGRGAGGGGYEVLVASDAVGMGLNLHIRR